MRLARGGQHKLRAHERREMITGRNHLKRDVREHFVGACSASAKRDAARRGQG